MNFVECNLVKAEVVTPFVFQVFLYIRMMSVAFRKTERKQQSDPAEISSVNTNTYTIYLHSTSYPDVSRDSLNYP